jgi:hypothetical protein
MRRMRAGFRLLWNRFDGLLRQFFAVLWLVALAASPGSAQVDRTGMSGTVTDSAGQMLAGVRITAVQDNTGLRRETLSSENGSYAIPQLPAGTYTVTFARDGFEQLTLTGVTQAAGRTRTLNATLKVSGISEHVEISGASLELSETSDSLGGRIERKQVEALPLNGRNWSTLTALVPGAIDAGGSNQRTIRFAGRGLDDNNFTSDGVDATNILNQAQQPFVRLATPTDTIQEFHIETMLFTADSGSTPGAQVAVNSASGTNRLHGDVFEFLRNDVVDARNPFDLNQTKPPFRLNQFGASVGGPIVDNKAFFFASFEGFRQTLGQTLHGFVPSSAFREQVASQSPALSQIINAYPRGGTQLNGRVAEFDGEGNQSDQENSGMIRIDQHFTDNTTAFARFNIDRAVSSVPLSSSGQTLTDRQETRSGPANAVVELLHVFSSRLIDEVKFGFNRSTAFVTSLNHNGLAYSVSAPGLTTQNNNQARIGAGNSFSWIDNLTWVKGDHVVKSGVEIRRIQLNQGNTAGGTIRFASLDALASDQVNSATFAAALPVNGLRKTAVYAFIQDVYKLTPNLTVSSGVRYQFYNRFHEVLNRAMPFDFATCGPNGFCRAGAEFSRPNIGDVDPRIAVAWAPARLRGMTLIRGGFGIYHGDGQLDDQNLPIANEVQRFSLSQATIAGLSFPIDPFLAGTSGIVSPRDMDRLRKDMYVSQWGLSIQQAITRDMAGTISYVGSKGTHLLTTSFINTIGPAGTRQFPAFGQVEFRANESNSSFQGLQASLQRSFRNGLLLSANYLWSHEIDDGSLGGGDADFPQNPECRRCERASGDFDARHTFSASAVYQLPFGAGRRYLSGPGFPRRLLSSWDLAAILAGRTGLPVNVTVDRSSSVVPDGNTQSQRPNLVPGVSLTPPGGLTGGLWINPAAFAVPSVATFGNAGRNLVRGPGIWQADLSIARRFSFRERMGLQLRVEAFNLLNRAQLGAPQADLSAGPGNFGAILSTVNVGPVGTGTPRQFQAALRVDF